MNDREQHDLRAPLARAKTAAKILAASPANQPAAEAETCALLLEALDELDRRLAALRGPRS